MSTLELSIEERRRALTEYIAHAEDPEKARAWIIECLDPESDAELLDQLADEQSPTSEPKS